MLTRLYVNTCTCICAAVGASDYMAIANTYKYVMISDVPVMTFDQREKIRRFITLLDVLYEHHVRLICSAQQMPQLLFQQANTNTQQQQPPPCGPNNVAKPDTQNSTPSPPVYYEDEQFACSRAVSRLIEMGSKEYIAMCATKRDQED